MKISKTLLIRFITIIILFILTFNFILELYLNYVKESKAEASALLFNKTEIEDTMKSNNNQAYESFFDFPYDNMVFSDDNTFKLIKEIYSKIDFFSEFKQGNLEIYDFYKEKYNQLLTNKITFIDKQIGKEFYLNEYSPIEIYNGDSYKYDVDNYIFYFFDIDEDSTPELGIFNSSIGTYIFKYVADLDEMILWLKLDSYCYQINGSKTVSWNDDGRYFTFYKLNKNGEEINSISFIVRQHYNIKDEKDEMIFMVSLPQYIDSKQIKITDLMKKQSYFIENKEIYYFRVTEIQFNELTKDYFNSLKIAQENIKEITYTYDKLFN